MHTATVHFQLNEALIHLRATVAELHDGRMQADDTSELAVQLGHILDHICKAWNARDRSPEQMAAVAQAEHDRMCNTVPNFHAESAGAVWLFCLPEASQLLAGEFSERKRMHVASCAKAFSRYQAFQP